MKYLPYILKHLRRNWIRTVTTILAIAVCIFLVTTLQTVLRAVNAGLESASASRLVTRHAVSLVFPLPLAYKERIRAVPGVRNVATSAWFGGVYQDMRNFFPNFAVDAEEYLAMYPEYILAPDEKQAFMEDMRGAVIGRGLAERFGWSVGSVFQLESFIPPYRKPEPFEFVVQAIYDVDRARHPGADDGMMLFHFRYLYEGTGRRVGAGIYVIEVADPDAAGAVARSVDSLFENSDAQTKTETESAFIAGFVSLFGNLALLLNLIGTAVAFTVLLVTANTMSMAVRERRTEMAVLKTLGFPSATVMLLVLAESVLLGVLGGALGILLGWGTINAITSIPMLGQALAGFPQMELSAAVGGAAFALAVLLGLAAGFVPATLAYRARITEMLRQV